MTDPTAITEPATGGKRGRPRYAEEQYIAWLEVLRPYLQKGSSLYYACNVAGLGAQYDSILEKYKLNDYFSKKIDAFRSHVGDVLNDTIVSEILRIADKKKQNLPLTDDEFDILKFGAEKLRTAQPFFVTRNETAAVDPKDVGKVLDTIEESDYGELGSEASKQMVEANAPVQDQK